MAHWSEEYLAMIVDCQKREAKLSEWEQTFVADIKTKIDNARKLTPNMIEKLNEIWERVTAHG